MQDDQGQSHDPDQLMFHQLADAPTPCTKRKPAHGIEVIEAASSPNTRTKRHSEAVLKLRWLLWKYIRINGIGHEFQAIDFSHWAKQQIQFDETVDVDLRSTGGMFLNLVKSGIIEKLGYRNNGGNKASNYHGTPRQAYRTVLLDYSRLGWLEDLAGIEQNGVWDESTPPRRNPNPKPKRVAS
jgi:hypothetical protein